jgi:acyl carrier protein
MSDDGVSSQSSLEQTLKRCRPEVIQAAVAYQKSKDTTLLPTIVVGVLERFVEPERRALLQGADVNDRKLQADLGMDSLVMVEVVMTLEEVLGQQIPDEELKGLYTIGDTLAYVNAKATGGAPPIPPERVIGEMLTMILNGQTPLVADVVLRDTRAEAVYVGSGQTTVEGLMNAGSQILEVWKQRKGENFSITPKPVTTELTLDAALPVQLRIEKAASTWNFYYLQTGRAATLLGHF